MKQADIKTKKCKETDLIVAEDLPLQQAIDYGCYEDRYLVKIANTDRYNVYKKYWEGSPEE